MSNEVWPIDPLCPSAEYPDRPYLTCQLERGHKGDHKCTVRWENDDDD